MHIFREAAVLVFVLFTLLSPGQETHNHPAPEQLGSVSFPTSCAPAVQPQFNRGMALLHSFTYTEAREAFQRVTESDSKCAMAHWGIAMSYFRQLWDPPVIPATIATAEEEIRRAQQIGAPTERETALIHALSFVYDDAAATPYRTRAAKYETEMSQIAAKNPKDVEAQVLYALALLANASPFDKTHARQKQAVAILEPLDRDYPDHPGIPHYLIHASDNAELAKEGLAAARAYSQIAPSAPHALHMPSHIFTRLGLWEDSIHANQASRKAARQHGDIGEELHAMDYLVYAYLQLGKDGDAADVLKDLNQSPDLHHADFKIGYASTAMPVRYAVERHDWKRAASIVPLAGAPPQVEAIAIWARGLGIVRGEGKGNEAARELNRLNELEAQLHSAGNEYWATQTSILARELAAWSAQSKHQPEQALSLMRQAADEEDAVEKLPVTPGPIVPAREQLGELLVAQNQPELAIKEFKISQANAPGRRGGMEGIARAQALSSNKNSAASTIRNP